MLSWVNKGRNIAMTGKNSKGTSPVSRHRITKEDWELFAEFDETPIGRHSPALRRLLNRFRGETLEECYVLVCVRPHYEWVLGQMNGPRNPVTLFPDVRFSSFEDGEREIFRRRWQRYAEFGIDT